MGILVSLLVVNTTNAGVVVSAKLSLVIDISGSVSTSEYNLMMDGYSRAFMDVGIRSNILSQENGIAANVVFFASTPTTNNAWFHLNSESSITAFANYLGSVTRPGSVGNQTGIGNAMNGSIANLLDNSEFTSSRLVMDVSGDGQNNIGVSPSSARDRAAVAGIRINGITIGGGIALFNHYDVNVRTVDGFVVSADSLDDFAEPLRNKIFLETQAVPEPSTMLCCLLGCGVIGFVGRVRR